MANVSIRMEDTLKKQTEAILDQLGMNMSTAVSIFAKAIVREQGIPFSLKIDPFYSDFNQAVLHQTIAAYESGQSAPVIKSMKELEEMTENE